MDTVVIARNREPPMILTFRSSHPSRCSHPPPTMASVVHSTWPTTPPTTTATTDADASDVSSRKENWDWSNSSVASDTA